jgi:hypothetical protein
MSAVKSAYLRTKVVKHVLGLASFSMPSTIYVALYTSDPTVNDTGTEVTGGSYARKPVTWGAESGGVVPSGADINFTNMPACTVTHWALRDAASGGNLLYFGPMDVPVVVNSGDTFPVTTGNLSVTEK